jgi:hypothetical protein
MLRIAFAITVARAVRSARPLDTPYVLSSYPVQERAGPHLHRTPRRHFEISSALPSPARRVHRLRRPSAWTRRSARPQGGPTTSAFRQFRGLTARLTKEQRRPVEPEQPREFHLVNSSLR